MFTTQWRHRADEARARAAETLHPDARAILLEVAARYELLASLSEQAVKAVSSAWNPPPKRTVEPG